MGFKLSKPKLKIKISAPKIKVGDPTKLVTAPIEGVANAQGRIAQNAVGNVGKVLSTPGSKELLGGVGAAYGLPGLGGLGTSANDFADRKAPFEANAPVQSYEAPKNNNMMIYIIGGLFAVVGIFFAMRKK